MTPLIRSTNDWTYAVTPMGQTAPTEATRAGQLRFDNKIATTRQLGFAMVGALIERSAPE